MKVAGLDPGAHTGIVIVDERGAVCDAHTVDLTGNMLERVGLLTIGIRRAHDLGAQGIVIEDMTQSHSIGARKGAKKRTSHSIASVQRDFAAAVALASKLWPSDRIILALVAQWYPRIRGQMVKKDICLRLQMQRAECADLGAAKLLKSEHLKVAYGLAMYGQGSRRFCVPTR